MSELLEEISQISIYLKRDGSEERINEVALLQPLAPKAGFNEENHQIAQRKWHFQADLSPIQRLMQKVNRSILQFLPSIRRSPEAKFKTVLAILLSQEALRDLFLGTEEQRESFFVALERGAKRAGYDGFSRPAKASPFEMSQELTLLEGKNVSLVDDPEELGRQMSALSKRERDALLYEILDDIKRPPVTSILEVNQENSDIPVQIEVSTRYAKYKVDNVDSATGKITFTASEDVATPSIPTQENMIPGAKGAINQRKAYGATTLLGSYSGELLTARNVLEQILYILEEKQEAWLLEKTEERAQDLPILFTSLFSWNELDKIQSQHNAINLLSGKILKTSSGCYKLHLIHRNTAFNAFNKFPSPGETDAKIRDLNEESLIDFAWRATKDPELEEIVAKIAVCKRLPFLEKEKRMLELIDQFRAHRTKIIDGLDDSHFGKALKTLLINEVSGMDTLILTDYVAKELGYHHNKNCHNSTDRSAGAIAADKAQNGFNQLTGHPFLPEEAKAEERSLFKVLYSMYLVWEEPEITSGLSTGFIGERFFKNNVQRNPETTRYLIRWLRRHPEIYTGLSNYR